MSTHTTAPGCPSFREALVFWTRLGFISFGGPAGQIAIMHTFLVEKKKWISERRFLHALNYCMLLPGPEAQQLATYTGWLLHGVWGGIAAGLLFILPSVFILLGLSIAYVLWGKLAWIAALFYGLKPAVVAIVVTAMWKMAKKSLIAAPHYVMAILSFVGIFFLHLPFPIIILVAVVAGLVLIRYFPALIKSGSAKAKADEEERQYYINAFSPPAWSPFTWSGLATKLGVGLLLWGLPLVVLYGFVYDFAFWSRLVLFFTEAALVTFGGAYAVLPYVAQVSVEKFHWLSSYEMMDGLALGETTPGPLIMVLVFVGFMAGYHQQPGGLATGALGLFTTTFYTFLPSFLFILIGAPWVERTQGNERLKSALTFVTSAVVGVVFNLALYFGKAVIFPQGLTSPDLLALVWAVASWGALEYFKVNMIRWIAVSAAAGILYGLILG